MSKLKCPICEQDLITKAEFYHGDPYNQWCMNCCLFTLEYEELKNRCVSFVIMKSVNGDTYAINSVLWIDGFEYFAFWREVGIFNIQSIETMKASHPIIYSQKLLPDDASEVLERLIKINHFQ